MEDNLLIIEIDLEIKLDLIVDLIKEKQNTISIENILE